MSKTIIKSSGQLVAPWRFFAVSARAPKKHSFKSKIRQQIWHEIVDMTWVMNLQLHLCITALRIWAAKDAQVQRWQHRNAEKCLRRSRMLTWLQSLRSWLSSSFERQKATANWCLPGVSSQSYCSSCRHALHLWSMLQKRGRCLGWRSTVDPAEESGGHPTGNY